MKKNILGFATVLVFIFTAHSAFAHVIVSPNQVGIAETTTFTISVPTENDGNTTGLRLLIPDGVNFVTPDEVAGWKVSVVRAAAVAGQTEPDGDPAPGRITEIDWTGGVIPSDFRQEFNFQAQVPATPTTLDWKAYQTYDDGSVVSWDQAPLTSSSNPEKMESDTQGPYSETAVVNDLTGSTQGAAAQTSKAPASNVSSSTEVYAALLLSIVAFVLALYAILRK